MTRERRLLILLAVLAGGLYLLSLLSGVLAPFVAGMAVAYFLDPLADRLEAKGASRTLATGLILAFFFLVLVGLLFALAPLLQEQVVGLLTRLPDLMVALRDQIAPLFDSLKTRLSAEDMQKLGSAASAYVGQGAQVVSKLLLRLWNGGLAVLEVLSLIVIMPLVSFYLLRDWDAIVAKVDSLLPRDMAPTVRRQVVEIDRTIAGFVRGQATVCLALGAFYAIGLTLVGLDFGLLVGLGTGLISFIPYFGMALGLTVGFGIALAQFSDWMPIALVAGVFGAGQVLEGFFLTPKLVGDKVGLHPVWVILALMAGGSLFGFTGVLLAVPVAAVIGVMIRFTAQQYLDSRLFHGHDWTPEAHGEVHGEAVGASEPDPSDPQDSRGES
ncbi:MAG: AI-2E family transporter [Rhodobacterales bacterium]|nr:AI-2E family transporter [Rhodobacterales bacterium]